MALEMYQLLRRLRDGEFDSSVVVTFNADLSFYEQVLLATLRARGCYNNLVLMDLRQYETALHWASGLLRGLGRLYGVWPVAAPSAFHPKIVLLCGERRGRLILGSGNLTVPGMSGNWEVFSETSHTPQAPNENLFRQVWKFIRSVTARVSSSVARQLRQVDVTSPWLQGDIDLSAWPRFLVARPGGATLAKQVAYALAGQTVSQLVVVAPFFDPALGGLGALLRELSPEKVSLVIQPKKVSLSGNALSRTAVDAYQFTPSGGSRSADAYLHAKLYLIETTTGEYCLWGSPNCSLAALESSAEHGNFETALLAKGPSGHFRERLGLGSSLSKPGRIKDFQLLQFREATGPKQSGRLQLVGVEFIDGNLEAIVASGGEVPREQSGRILLTTGGREFAEVLVERSGEWTYRGRWNPEDPEETVLARLVLGSGADAVESTFAAVHFCTLLARAAPSRRAAAVRALLEEIRAGTAAWADGLEKVCEIIFRLEASKAGQSVRNVKAKVKDDVLRADTDEGKEVAYEHFVTDPHTGSGTGSLAGSQSSLLVELVQLAPRLLAGIQSSDDTEGQADSDSWRYQEEAERDTAEKGDVSPPEVFEKDADGARNTPSPNRAAGPDSQVGLHRRLRKGYQVLMKKLAQRAEHIRNEEQVASRDELLQFHLVATLVLQATDREVNGASQCGPVLQAKDLEHELLPSIAILLGRSCKAPLGSDKSTGPTLLRGSDSLSDPESRDAACMVTILLAALVAHRKLQATANMHFARDRNRLSDCLELVAARSFMALQTLGAFPAPEVLEKSIQSLGPAFPWLFSLRESAVAAFNDLADRSRRMREVESSVPPEGHRPPAPNTEPGDWVCTKHWGVTEVLEFDGQSVNVAIVDACDPNSLVRASISRTKVRVTGMQRSY